MKIAHIVCTFPPYKGGMGNVAFDYAKTLQKNGDDVTVFTPAYTKKSRTYPFKVIKLIPFLKYGNAAFLPQLFFYLWKGKFDIIHLHYPFFGTMEVVFLFKKLFFSRTKLVIHYHMQVVGLSWYLELLRLPSKIIEKPLFKIANQITCASIDYLKNTNKNIYNLIEDRLVEIPFSVNTDLFKFKTEKKKQILFVGGMDKAHYFKGIKILLEAFASIREDYNLVLVGSGDLMNDYKKQAKDLNLEEKVTFTGNLDNDELIERYQDSALFILPSINACEAFGLVLLEAMSCGTPVIASDLFGVRKVFQDGIQGYYFHTGSVLDLENKINKILENKDSLVKMGKKARELVTSKYSSEVINKNLVEFYKSLL